MNPNNKMNEQNKKNLLLCYETINAILSIYVQRFEYLTFNDEIRMNVLISLFIMKSSILMIIKKLFVFFDSNLLKNLF